MPYTPEAAAGGRERMELTPVASACGKGELPLYADAHRAG
jgi:hypothetical protein